MTELSYAAIRRKKRQRLGLLAAAIALAVLPLALYVASDNAVTDEHGVVASKDNTLSISGPWEISSLDPSKQGYILSRMQLVETLLNVADNGEMIPGLATHWQRSDDGLSWDFILRKDVRFHDGTLMDADAVVRALGHAQRKHGILNKADITSITAISPSQVRITLAKPYNAFPSLLTNYANAILAPNAYQLDGSVQQLIGTGAYQLESFSPPHKLMVKKFSDYWGNRPQIDFATYLTGHRAESRILQAKSGEVDLVFSLDPAMLAQLENSEVASIQSHATPRTMFIKLNAGHPFLAERKAREALNLALDRAAIANNVLHSEDADSAQLLPPSMAKWHLDDADNAPYNLEKAQALLAELGWQRSGSGALMRDGKPFTLTLMTYADRPELTAVATAIQAQWAKLGIELKVDVTNSSMIPAGHHDGSLDMALIARNYGFSADPLPLITSDFANGGGDWGAMNWHNAVVDEAIVALNQTDSAEKSRALSQQIAREIQQELPVLPLLHYTQHTAVNKRVAAFSFDPFERDYFINQMRLVPTRPNTGDN